MVNLPPDFCPYCGTKLETVEEPTIYRCESCDDYVFHNPCPAGGVAVLDGDSILLVEDFRSSGEWKLPEGRVECGESPREGVARELEEETGLTVDPAVLTYFHDSAGEPVENQYMANVDFAVERSETAGTLDAGSDAIDARFWTPEEFADSDQSFRASHLDRFGNDDIEWLRDTARLALEG
ncbi:NUDIX domain-containing protein [Halorussus halophilus]|uniref:NUDIX domain-containing protein n=1 Tax=Halorussus halophilus TaxID=2650975 RepID=UPI0017878309|nr:NUDIX domain-containing protein [Halorussus halophilus]